MTDLDERLDSLRAAVTHSAAPDFGDVLRRRRNSLATRAAASAAVVAIAVTVTALALPARPDPDSVVVPAHRPSATLTRTGTPTASVWPEPIATSTGDTAPTSVQSEKPSIRPSAPNFVAGQRVVFGQMVVVLPKGWSVAWRDQLDRSASDHPRESMCVAPAGNRGTQVFNCAGLRFDRGSVPGAGTWLFAAHQSDGWYEATDVSACPATDGHAPGGGLDGLRPGGRPIRTGFAPIGERKAAFDEWTAQCDHSGFSFRPRSWYLPQSHYRVLDYLGHPETDWILAHITFN